MPLAEELRWQYSYVLYCETPGSIADITLICGKPESEADEAREELEKLCAEVIFVDNL